MFLFSKIKTPFSCILTHRRRPQPHPLPHALLLPADADIRMRHVAPRRRRPSLHRRVWHRRRRGSLGSRIAVNHRIKLLNYFRIADALLTQANIYREEKNLLELYVILLRYSSLLCETIPKHRDYRQFKSREKEFFKKQLLDVVNELELLKPVVQQQITELNRGDTMEPRSLNGAYDATHRTEQHTSRSHTPQPLVGCATGSLQKFGRHAMQHPYQVSSLTSRFPNISENAYPRR